MRAWIASVLMAGLIAVGGASAEEPAKITVYKDPQCGCCSGYVDYLRRSGFEVTAVDTHDLPLIKREHGVPEALEGCHTSMVDGYVVEGHVPVSILRKLLAEKPHIKGISLPGMPTGSPGMTGKKTGPFKVYEVTTQQPAPLYATN